MQLVDKKEIVIISLTKTYLDRVVNYTDTNNLLGYKVTVKEKRNLLLFLIYIDSICRCLKKSL